mmetsp:Transcript_109790/g.354458  ORF Transcript_109790/g.354458 Transcript_109790/m.354458 type:complete len:241 (-) Transcript_109790:2311-3033(-)
MSLPAAGAEARSTTRPQKASCTAAEAQCTDLGAPQPAAPRHAERAQSKRPTRPTVSWLLLSTASWLSQLTTTTPERSTEVAARAPICAMRMAGGESSAAVPERRPPAPAARFTTSWRIAKLTAQPPRAFSTPAATRPGSPGEHLHLGPACRGAQPDISWHVRRLSGGSMLSSQSSSRPLPQLTVRNCRPSPQTLEQGPQGPSAQRQPVTLMQGFVASGASTGPSRQSSWPPFAHVTLRRL